MKNILYCLLLLMSSSIFAQKISDYRYVVVPDKYDFLKKADTYQLNSLTKFLLNKYGFDAYLQKDDKPFNIGENACDVLYADVEEDSNFIQTRLAVLLKDCNGETIYKTTQGRSKEKDYKDAHHEALRGAFMDIEALKVSYSDKKEMTASISNEIAQVSKESQRVVDSIKKPKASLTLEKNEQQELLQKPGEVTSKVTPVQITDSALDTKSIQPDLYTSEDGFYKAVRYGDAITFYEGDKSIGNAVISKEETFGVSTSQFEGNAFFREGRLIVERKIKGVVGVVEMIFTKQ